MCLQESKVPSDDFPAAEVAAFGYPHVEVHGQKGYNRVAILARHPLTTPRRPVCCDPDDCRHLAVSIGGTGLLTFYIPAARYVSDPETNPKLAHTLTFLRVLSSWAGTRTLIMKRLCSGK